MKKLIIASILASLAWAQELTLKKNNQTATITYNQPIEIVTKNYDVFSGRFQKIENNSIFIEGRIIAIDKVKQIKLPYSRLKCAFKGFQKGGKWKIRASHWSPVTGGSGTSQSSME